MSEQNERSYQPEKKSSKNNSRIKTVDSINQPNKLMIVLFFKIDSYQQFQLLRERRYRKCIKRSPGNLKFIIQYTIIFLNKLIFEVKKHLKIKLNLCS